MHKVSLEHVRWAAKAWNDAWRTYAIATVDGGFATTWNSARYPRMTETKSNPNDVKISKG